MKAIYQKITLIIVLATLPLTIGAQCNPDFCGLVYIDKLYTHPNGIVYVGTSGDESVLNCAAVAGVHLTFDINDPGSSAIYSTLLTALTVNKQVVIQVADNSVGCLVQYVTIDRV